MAKEPYELKWIEDLLPEGNYRRKPMFGGFAYYIEEKLILATFESPGDSKYRGLTYSMDLWNGCMFPVEKVHHAEALRRFPFLVEHPVLPKWLYLPLNTENFEELASDVLRQAIKPQSYWGSFPKAKHKMSRRTIDDGSHGKLDTRRPRMFSDEPKKKTKKG